MSDKLSSVDWLGSSLMVISSTTFLVGMSWGGNKYEWRSAAVLVPILVGLAGLVLTVLYERYAATNPFLRLSVFQHWSELSLYDQRHPEEDAFRAIDNFKKKWLQVLVYLAQHGECTTQLLLDVI